MVCALSVVLHKDIPKLTTLAVIAAAIGFTILFSASIRFSPGLNVVHQHLPYYQLHRLIDEPQQDGKVHRHMLHDNIVQGTLELGRLDVPQEFQRIWRLLKLHRDTLNNALFVGGGTYGVPQLMSKRWPDMDITVLEVDQSVLQSAREWFFLMTTRT